MKFMSLNFEPTSDKDFRLLLRFLKSNSIFYDGTLKIPLNELAALSYG